MLQGLPTVLVSLMMHLDVAVRQSTLKPGGWVKGKMCSLLRYLILNKIKREIGIKVLFSNVLKGIIL